MKESFVNTAQAECSQAIFKLVLFSYEKNEKSNGTAFIFYEDEKYYYLLTAHHCSKEGDRTRVLYLMDYKGEVVENVEILYEDKDYEQTILRFKKSLLKDKREPLVISFKAKLQDKDDLLVVGSGDGYVNRVYCTNYVDLPIVLTMKEYDKLTDARKGKEIRQGVIQAVKQSGLLFPNLERSNEFYSFLQDNNMLTMGDIPGGFSGSPIFNTDFEVVGMVVFGWGDVSLGILYSGLNEYLEKTVYKKED